VTVADAAVTTRLITVNKTQIQKSPHIPTPLCLRLTYDFQASAITHSFHRIN